MCDEAVCIGPRSLAFIPDRFKTEGLCVKAVKRDPYAHDCVPNNLAQKNMKRGNTQQPRPSSIFSCP